MLSPVLPPTYQVDHRDALYSAVEFRVYCNQVKVNLVNKDLFIKFLSKSVLF